MRCDRGVAHLELVRCDRLSGLLTVAGSSCSPVVLLLVSSPEGEASDTLGGWWGADTIDDATFVLMLRIASPERP